MSMPRQSSVTVTTVGLESRRWYLAMPCRRLSIQTCYFPMTVPMSFLLLSPSIRGADCASGACCSQAISFIYDSGVKPSSFIFRNHLRTPRRWRSRSSIKFLRWSSSFGADCVCGPCMRRRADRPTDRPTAPRPRPACTRVRSRCRRNYFRVKKGARKRRRGKGGTARPARP